MTKILLKDQSAEYVLFLTDTVVVPMGSALEPVQVKQGISKLTP